MTLVPPRSIRGLPRDRVVQLAKRAPSLGADLREDLARLGRLAARKAGPAGLDDARLFEGYLFDAVAEPLGVLELDRRDDAGRRIDDVGRIEAPSQARFDHRGLAARPAESAEGDQGPELEVGGQLASGEIRGVLAFYEGQKLVHRREQGFLRHLVARHGDSLLPAEKMGRCIESRPDSRCLEYAGDHGGDRTLALRTRHVDRVVGFLGIAQKGAETAHAIELELDLLALLDVHVPHEAVENLVRR